MAGFRKTTIGGTQLTKGVSWVSRVILIGALIYFVISKVTGCGAAG